MADKCYCGRDLESVGWESTPCCHKPLCWDYCLYNHTGHGAAPFKCPYCGETLCVDDGEVDYGGDYQLIPVHRTDVRYGPSLLLELLGMVSDHLVDDPEAKPVIEWAVEWGDANDAEEWPLEAPPMKEPDREE